jgi:hypothetical protein
MNPNFIANQPSEGEQFLADFFDSVGIKYEPEKRIDGLKNDTKQYRTADFYLPRYKVYVEFFGLWNNNGNEKYKQKKEIYRLNNVPCVYLYPENLGIIGYAFDKRLQLVLEKHGMKRELKKYRIYKLWEAREFRNRTGILALCIMAMYFAFFSVEIDSLDWSIVALVASVTLYQAVFLHRLCMDIFRRNKYSLDEL